MSIFKNASSLLEEQQWLPKKEDVPTGRNYKVCDEPILEEGMTPIDFAIKIKSSVKRITRLLKSKGWTQTKKEKNSEYINIGFMGGHGDEKRVTILSIPNPDKIDDNLNGDPSWIPTAILSNFHSKDGGKTWDRYQEVFPFDNANTTKKTSNNIMEYALEDVYEYQDMVNIDGSELGGTWEDEIKKPESIKAKKVKTIG